MKCRNVDNTSFGARLTTDRYAQAGKKLRKYLENGIIEFEKQTKNKEGCMTLRQLDDLDDSPEAVFFFWNSKTAPRHYDGYMFNKSPQIAYTTRDFLKHLITDKTPKEQASIFESIFDTLQVIPKKITKNERNNADFMSSLREQIFEKLGKNKDLLSPMFKHITDSMPNGKKITIEDIDF